MNLTAIRWTDFSWGFGSGCDDAGPECEFCYARDRAENPRFRTAFPNGFELTLRPHKLREPLKLAKPSLIFAGSMTDLGFRDYTDDYRDAVLDVMHEAHWHRFQLLSKHLTGLAAYLKRRGPLPTSAGAELDGRVHEGLPVFALPKGWSGRSDGKRHLSVLEAPAVGVV
jgi:protein gp37